jgi:tetratricopeptide (TPR) repeat protein
MKRRPERAALAGLLVAALGACAAIDSAETAVPPPASPAETLATTEATSPPAPATEVRPVPRRDGDEIWHDPVFKRRFAESYMAETDVEPAVTEDEREQLQQLLELMGAGKLDEAAGLVDKYNAPAASAVFDFTLGNLFFQQEHLDAAVTAFQAAITKHAKFRRAWRNLGLAQVRLGKWREAAEAFTRVVELGGGDAFVYGLLGFAYANVDDSVAAESAYRLAILLDGKTVDWKLGLARSFFKQERFADAVALCQTLIGQNADRAELWLLQANAYIGMKQPLKAAENYEIVDRLGASTADTLNTLGDIYVNEEVFDLAVASYLRAMDKDPTSKPERAIRAARVLTARGAVAESRAIIDRVEELHGRKLLPDERKELLRLRARQAMATGAGEEEARILEEIVKLDPLDGEALILLGQHAGRTGNAEKAAFYYERAAGIEAFEADAKVRHAQLLVGQGKYAAALPLLKRAQALKPRDNVQEYLEQVERVAQTR